MWHRTFTRGLFHNFGGMHAVRWLHRKGVTILMYHKFPADRRMLEGQCEYLQQHHKVLSLGRLSQLLQNGEPLPERAVVITVDDGHRGFYEHGYPVFAKFNFPVTMYLTTGPMDRHNWLWFDRVEYAFLSSRRKAVELPKPATKPDGGQSAPSEAAPQTDVLGSTEQRLALAEQYMERMKTIPFNEFSACLHRLEQALEVQVPDEPPEKWAMLTWDQVRLMARERIEFGAHSVNHPILARLGGEKEVYEEIVGSRDRIQAELNEPVLHFAYPNGQPQDLSPIIVKTVSDAGFRTAVTTVAGQVFPTDNPFLLRRVSAGVELPLHRFQTNAAAFRV